MTVLTIHDLWNGKSTELPDNVVPLHPDLTHEVQTRPEPEEPEKQPDLEGLLKSIKDLTARISWLEHERAEAIHCANQLADQRDHLGAVAQDLEATVRHTQDRMEWLDATVEAMAEAVSKVAASPAAVLVRRRLMAAIAL